MAIHRDEDGDCVVELDDARPLHGPNGGEQPDWIMVWDIGASHISIRPQYGSTLDERHARPTSFAEDRPTNQGHDIDVPVVNLPELIEALIDRAMVKKGTPRMALRAVLCDALAKLTSLGSVTE